MEQCRRCNATSGALPGPPMPTDLGREVHENVCAACWQEWLGAQVMLINEYRLVLVDPEVRRALEGQMRAFLHLDPKP